MAVTHVTASAFISLMLAMLPPVDGHARLWEPPGRSTMWRREFGTPVNYQDNELFCGGFEHQVQLGYKCGVCGDPFDGRRDNEAGGKYATGVITRTYRQGQNVTFQVDLTANHKGYFEFKICPTNDPKKQETQECFDPYPPDNALRSISVTLPKDLTCEFCVLQFRYHAGNSWGTDPDGKSCIGCGNQEEFYGCSDIRILPHSSSQPVIEEPVKEAPKYTATTTNSYPSERTTTMSTDSSRKYDRVYNGAENDASNYLQSPDDRSINGDNIVCRGVGHYTDLDEWCQLNCQLGHCPETHCQCDKFQYMHGTKRETGCRAAGGFASVQGYDTWCRDNCARGHCPSSLCIC
ncbi:unnamed protein product [Candidula unifasciata]|uniref:Chitin-binding type-4 domain-containing protein n=1 Tax=Candidula unifasciata TaxID=100452 RepID=A0A8S3Z964_9EUPU|nr:unnamed protein product [Candidula unifasciata]